MPIPSAGDHAGVCWGWGPNVQCWGKRRKIERQWWWDGIPLTLRASVLNEELIELASESQDGEMEGDMKTWATFTQSCLALPLPHLNHHFMRNRWTIILWGIGWGKGRANYGMLFWGLGDCRKLLSGWARCPSKCPFIQDLYQTTNNIFSYTQNPHVFVFFL